MRNIFFCVAILISQAAPAQPYLTLSAGASRSELGRGVEKQQPLPGFSAAAAIGYRLGRLEPQAQAAYHRYGAQLEAGRLRADYLNAAALLYLHLPTAGPDHSVAVGAGPQVAVNIGGGGEGLSGWATGFFIRVPGFCLHGQYHQSLNLPATERTNYYSLTVGLPIGL